MKKNKLAEYWPIQASSDMDNTIAEMIEKLEEMSKALKDGNVKSAVEKGEYEPALKKWKKEFYDKD